MTNEDFLIQGPVGQLEVMITRPKGIEKSVTGIICHPHPLHGGTMNNKVVTTLAKALDELGLKTVRFNFRGVQKVAQLISVAPPVFYEGFASLTQMASPWLIVQGDQDEVVPFEQVKAFVNQISSPVEFVVMSGASHFFHGRLIELRELLVRNLA
ncbi:alpha/beta hydrolase [Coxiella burnetii]|uniref:alpha/beta hydrolase n=1 Tax=Coxiella burnetii TaxID=777 RepID=UPI0005927EEE|nr:alpha/beta hydrolase [Coxiella burnetii]